MWTNIRSDVGYSGTKRNIATIATYCAIPHLRVLSGLDFLRRDRLLGLPTTGWQLQLVLRSITSSGMLASPGDIGCDEEHLRRRHYRRRPAKCTSAGPLLGARSFVPLLICALLYASRAAPSDICPQITATSRQSLR